MKKAIIITATQGLGFSLQKTSKQYGISSKTYSIGKCGVGESKALPAEKTDYALDISNEVTTKIEDNFDFIVWNTGVFLHKEFSKTTDAEIDTLIDLHYRFPLKIMRNLHQKQTKPYHFIAISSCSSWRMREFEAIYCGLCAAKATFVRNFANELSDNLPGSKVTLINPGGVRTAFYYEEDEPNLEGYLNQEKMSNFIWSSALEQEKTFVEIQYLRNKTSVCGFSEPIIEYGTKCAETI